MEVRDYCVGGTVLGAFCGKGVLSCQGVLLGGLEATRGGLGPYSKSDEKQADAKRPDSRFSPEMQFRGLLFISKSSVRI